MRTIRRYPPKPIDQPDHVTVLIPTRGKPEAVDLVFRRFDETVARRDLLDVWIYVDDDDEVTRGYIAEGKWRRFDLDINWHVAPQKNSMGEMFNELWQHSTVNAGVYIPFCDDLVIDTAGWDEAVRRTFRRSGDGFLLGYLADPTALAHQVTIAVPSARWLNAMGYFISDRFYYWFADIWLDEIAQMVDRKALVPVRVLAPEGKGKTPRLRNLPFWCGYYHALLPLRFREACQMLEQMHAGDPAAHQAALLHARKVAAVLRHKSFGPDTAALRADEARFREMSRKPRATQVASYLVSEAQAVAELTELVHEALNHQEPEDVLDLLEPLEHASFAVPDLYYLKAESLHRLGYRADALAAIDREMELRPEEPKGAMLKEEIASAPEANRCYASERISLRLPAWIGLEERAFILFPEEIDQELYFTLQHIIHLDPAVESVLDIGAGTGSGSSRAIMDAATARPGVTVCCIEPNLEKFRLLSRAYGGSARLYNGASVPPERYLADKELERFYQYVPTVLNTLPLELFREGREQELAYLRQHRLPADGIAALRGEAGIDRFGLVLLDGSLFCGEADLAAVYGARYLALNYVNSIKNYANFKKLLDDPSYRLISVNLKSRCGYAVFLRE